MPEPGPIVRWRRLLSPVTVDGLRTHVFDDGLGDPVVFLHGIPTQAYLWRDVARVVAVRHRVVAPDLLGFGFSDRPRVADYSPRGQATFIAHALDELGVGDFAVVAHDFGALVAAEFIARDPDRVSRLVITNTSFWSRDWRGSSLSPSALLRLRGVGEVAFWLARPFMLRVAFGLYVNRRERLSSSAMQIYWHPFANGFSSVLLRLARENRLTEPDFRRWRHALRDYQRPALVAWGAQDRAFTTDRGRSIARFMPNAGFRLFETSNHFIPEDAPLELGETILNFLAEK